MMDLDRSDQIAACIAGRGPCEDWMGPAVRAVLNQKDYRVRFPLRIPSPRAPKSEPAHTPPAHPLPTATPATSTPAAEDPRPGILQPTHRVMCAGACRRVISLPYRKRPEAAAVLREHGWRETLGFGWMCPPCRDDANRARIQRSHDRAVEDRLDAIARASSPAAVAPESSEGLNP